MGTTQRRGDGIVRRKRADGTTGYAPRIYRHGKHEWLATFDTLQEAKEARLEALSAVSTGHRETAGDFARRWAEEYPRPKVSTRKLYAQNASRFASDTEALKVGNRIVVVPELDLNRITRPIARAYVLRRRHLHPMLSAMFNDALNDGLVKENPFARLGLPQSRGRRDIKVLTGSEVERLADCALEVHGEYGATFRALILFTAYTGVRNGEAYALEWDDIDWKASEVDIRRRSYEGDIDLPKSNVTRRIILPPAAAGALRTIPRAPDQRLVFLSKTGKPFRKARLADYWLKVWQRFAGGLDEARTRDFEGNGASDFYALRHFCATHLLSLGLSAEDVAEQLGHQDGGELVRTRYGHPSKEAARERLHRAFDRNVTPLRVADQDAEVAHG